MRWFRDWLLRRRTRRLVRQMREAGHRYPNLAAFMAGRELRDEDRR